METRAFGQPTAQRWANSTHVNHRTILYVGRRYDFYTRAPLQRIDGSLQTLRIKQHVPPCFNTFFTTVCTNNTLDTLARQNLSFLCVEIAIKNISCISNPFFSFNFCVDAPLNQTEILFGD